MHLSLRTLGLPLVAAVVGISALAGCGSSSKSSSSTNPTTTTTTASSGSSAAGTSPVCQAYGNLQSSVSQLTDPSTLSGGKSSIQSALDSVKQTLGDLKTTVSSGDKPKVDALQSSIDDLQKAINDLDGVSGAGAVASAAADVGQSAQTLFDALKAGCPTS